ncbi:MAG: PAAR domain-containing protein [Rhodomicrobium sp.]
MKRREVLDVMVPALALLLIAAPVKAQNANLPSGSPAVIVEGSGDVSAGGQAAARKGDTADDKQPIAGGSKNVFINGRAAVTAGDRTACGGVTVGGASNVLVNGKPIARSGDLTTGCPGK